jgi:hypothetical protein
MPATGQEETVSNPAQFANKQPFLSWRKQDLAQSASRPHVSVSSATVTRRKIQKES